MNPYQTVYHATTHDVPTATGGTATCRLRHVGTDAGEKLFATYFTTSGAGRYQFAVTGDQSCVYTDDADRGVPPLGVLVAVRDAGWEVENLPEADPSDPLWDRLQSLTEVLETLEAYYGDLDMYTPTLFDRAQKMAPAVLALQVIREATTPDEYTTAVDRMIATLPGVTSVDDLLTADIETRQQAVLTLREVLPESAHEEYDRLLYDRGLAVEET